MASNLNTLILFLFSCETAGNFKIIKNTISLVSVDVFWVCFYVHQLALHWCLPEEMFAWWKKGRSGVHRKK